MKCPHCGKEVKLWEALVPKPEPRTEFTAAQIGYREVRSTGQLGRVRREERRKKK